MLPPHRGLLPRWHAGIGWLACSRRVAAEWGATADSTAGTGRCGVLSVDTKTENGIEPCCCVTVARRWRVSALEEKKIHHSYFRSFHLSFVSSFRQLLEVQISHLKCSQAHTGHIFHRKFVSLQQQAGSEEGGKAIKREAETGKPSLSFRWRVLNTQVLRF